MRVRVQDPKRLCLFRWPLSPSLHALTDPPLAVALHAVRVDGQQFSLEMAGRPPQLAQRDLQPLRVRYGVRIEQRQSRFGALGGLSGPTAQQVPRA